MIWSVIQYLRFYLRAKTPYQVHSPLASLIIQCLFAKSSGAPHQAIESWRNHLLSSRAEVGMHDYGAGSKQRFAPKVKISALAKSSLTSHAQCLQLYHLCRWRQPDTVLELGTSFGITTAYLQLGQPAATVISLEGNPELVASAKIFHQQIFKKQWPEILAGPFDQTLPEQLLKIDSLDLVFIDGNHTYDATIRYLKQILPVTNDDTLIIIHDIYWSSEMTAAWNFCKRLDRVTMSIDLFHMGILLFSPTGHQNQHYSLVPFYLKPWGIGLFAT